MPDYLLSYPVPYAAQLASPELALDIFDGDLDPREDPRWRESGAETPDEYAYWTDRACGVVCVKMCVEALGGRQQSMVEWARAGVAIGGYLVAENPDGTKTEKGWLHKGLAALIKQEGFPAQPMAASPQDILAHLRAGRMVIASVSFEIGTDRPVTHAGGHLVVIYGVEMDAERINAFIANNPSGRRVELRESARIPIQRFLAAFSGRIIVVG